MNAPKSLMLTTVPSRICPFSKSDTIIWIRRRASSIIALSVPHTETAPSSVISIFTPVRSINVLIVLPRCPTTSPIFAGSIMICLIFGAYSFTSFLGSAIALLITSSRIYVLASFVRRIAPSTISRVRPWILISI